MEPASKPAVRLFIRVKEAAKILDLHHQTLLRWIGEGRGPPVQRFGKGKNRTIRINYPEFMKWIEKPRKGKHRAKTNDRIRTDRDRVAADV